jgi:hypothetical protein
MIPRPSVSRRILAPLVLVALASAAAVTLAPRDSRADAPSIDYVDCRWQPFTEAWACSLPATFTEGRFGAPPDFKQDSLSSQLRQRAWSNAKATPGARTRGRVGVFVPQQDSSWLFVPGLAWSPGEIVFLPRDANAKATAKR